MFDFFSMLGNHDERQVAREKINDFTIDTCAVTDGRPFETAISHPAYNEGTWIIVEAYDTKENAIAGHSRWVEVAKKRPPDFLTDCGNGAFGIPGVIFPHKRVGQGTNN